MMTTARKVVTMREAFAQLDHETLEEIRHAAEDEIRDRMAYEEPPEETNELGSYWPMPADDRAFADFKERTLTSLFDVILRGAENG